MVAPTLNNKRFKPFKAFPLNFLIPYSLLLFYLCQQLPKTTKYKRLITKIYNYGLSALSTQNLRNLILIQILTDDDYDVLSVVNRAEGYAAAHGV